MSSLNNQVRRKFIKQGVDRHMVFICHPLCSPLDLFGKYWLTGCEFHVDTRSSIV